MRCGSYNANDVTVPFNDDGDDDDDNNNIIGIFVKPH